MGSRLTRISIVLALALLGAGAFGAVQRDLASDRNLHQSSYATAAQCARCHPDHSASFRRTFHRTMTQAASPESVRGNFDGVTLDYFGVQARMERDAQGKHVIRYQVPGSAAERFVVDKTVGSRRYQQYIAHRGTEQVRLPLAFHIEEQRWFHMNGAFLTPDPQPAAGASLARADYERHVTRWNDNCVFCHNVAPNPGKRPGAHGSAAFETELAELGVACEACHGPGERHASDNTNPLRRYALHLSGARDPSIVNPARLSPARSLDVCGRCHGQRITDDVERFLRAGDPFIPGEDLALYSAPLWRDSTLRGERVFEARFWEDGTPRLTAYEYQGTLLSPCAQRGALTCLSCHGMHEGDPRGQIRPALTGATMCTQCHESLRSERAQAAHSHHAAGPAQPSCNDCHMPKIVYGVLDVHPSHRIESPDPAKQAASDRPDACTLCHADKSRGWAEREHARLFKTARTRAPAADAPAARLSELESQLFAGDPIQRALAAHALARPPAPAQTSRRLSLLLEAMENDPYPAIRHLAQRAARALSTSATLAAFVPETSAPERARALAELRRQFPLPAHDASVVHTLRAQSEQRAIEIGE